MDLELSGRRAIVTGASRGIGLAVAGALAREGVAVAMVARGADALRSAATDVTSHGGGRALAVPADTGVDESVQTMVAEVCAQFGGVDILVCAAATPNSPAGLSEDSLEHEINVKVRGYLRCARAVAPVMVQQGWGRIINISGLAARRTGSVVGSVRNVAVAAMTKNLADELGPLGVNVTVVHPGMTRTERTATLLTELAHARGATPEQVQDAIEHEISIGRMVTAEEIADVVTFLASPRSVALNGDPVAAGGGLRGSIYY